MEMVRLTLVNDPCVYLLDLCRGSMGGYLIAWCNCVLLGSPNFFMTQCLMNLDEEEHYKSHPCKVNNSTDDFISIPL
jgi:hypothetical protein